MNFFRYLKFLSIYSTNSCGTPTVVPRNIALDGGEYYSGSCAGLFQNCREPQVLLWSERCREDENPKTSARKLNPLAIMHYAN